MKLKIQKLPVKKKKKWYPQCQRQEVNDGGRNEKRRPP